MSYKASHISYTSLKEFHIPREGEERSALSAASDTTLQRLRTPQPAVLVADPQGDLNRKSVRQIMSLDSRYVTTATLTLAPNLAS